MRYSVGSVAFLLASKFRENGVTATRWPDAPPHGARPYVCVEATKSHGLWLALNTRSIHGSISRLEIPAKHKFGSCKSWHSVPTYLDDSAFIYTIPWASLGLVLSPANPPATAGITPASMKRIIDDMNSPLQIARRSGVARKA